MLINNVNINYVQYGNKEAQNIILLHGWGQNIEMMKPLGDFLALKYNVTIFDLPGFGKSDKPSFPWEVIDYAETLHELIIKLNINDPILIGHSFGGKISLLYATKYKVSKLILFGSPFKKEITKISLKLKLFKFAKKIPLLNKLEEKAKKVFGSKDYKQADSVMREILVNTVNNDISSELNKIKAPTLLVWGTNDEAVSLDLAYELETLINDAGLVVYEGATHYAYLERLEQTKRVIESFLGGN